MIKRIITYFLIITVLLYGFRYLHYKGLLIQTTGYYGKLNTAFFQKNSYDVIFLGSSRAEMHYNTRLFDSLTGSNSFNLSVAGASPQAAFAILKAYLFNSKAPKFLIYEVDYHYLHFTNDHIKDFNNYFPFLSNSVLRSEFNKIDGRMNQFYYNPYFSLPFTGSKNLSTGLHGWLNIPNQKDSLYYKGYFKESLRPALKFQKVEPYEAVFNMSNRNYMDSIAGLCKQNNIHLCFVSSPIFAGGKVNLTNKKQITDKVKNIATINGISYIDLSSLSFCNDRSLFIDHFHLNYLGANKFTEHFCSVFNNKIASSTLK